MADFFEKVSPCMVSIGVTCFVLGFATCYAIGIIKFDIRVSRHKKNSSSQPDVSFSQDEMQKLEAVRDRVRQGLI